MKSTAIYLCTIMVLLVLMHTGCSDLETVSGPDYSPMIKSVIPARAPLGARVMIGGVGFGSDQQNQEVYFNETKAEIEVLTDTTILTRVPKEAATGPIRVVAGGDTLMGPTFTVDTSQNLWLDINNIRPERGRFGDTVRVFGEGFKADPELNNVYFNEGTAPVISAQDTMLTAIVPPEATTGAVMIVVEGDTAVGPSFEVIIPEITEIAPDSGPVGTEVLISGSGFSEILSENHVTFNGIPTNLESATATELLAIVPENAGTGPVRLSINDYTVEGPSFTVREPKSIQIAVMTEGTQTDQDGYVLSVSGKDDRLVEPIDEVVYNDIFESTIEITLDGVANNCRVEGKNPREVTLNTDDMVTTTFNIDCTLDFRGKVLFETNRDGNNELYALNPEGMSDERITETIDVFESTPAISPDGLSIAFSANTENGAQIFIMDSDGSNVRQITESGHYFSPAWSPHGDKLAFQGYTNSEITDLYTINVDGSDMQNITNTQDYPESHPDWSPDGSYILFSRYEENGPEIYTIREDGTDRVQLTNNMIIDDHPEWSPDGERIVFIRTVPEIGPKVHVMNSDGTEAKTVTPMLGPESYPTWSPDGASIAFSVYSEGAYQLVIYSLEYNDIIYSSWTPYNELSPHWNYH